MSQRGPNGEIRPDDEMEAAALVVKIATGEVKEDKPRRQPKELIPG